MKKVKKGVTFNHNPLLRSELSAWRPRRLRSSCRFPNFQPLLRSTRQVESLQTGS